MSAAFHGQRRQLAAVQAVQSKVAVQHNRSSLRRVLLPKLAHCLLPVLCVSAELPRSQACPDQPGSTQRFSRGQIWSKWLGDLATGVRQ